MYTQYLTNIVISLVVFLTNAILGPNIIHITNIELLLEIYNNATMIQMYFFSFCKHIKKSCKYFKTTFKELRSI